MLQKAFQNVSSIFCTDILLRDSYQAANVLQHSSGWCFYDKAKGRHHMASKFGFKAGAPCLQVNKTRQSYGVKYSAHRLLNRFCKTSPLGCQLALVNTNFFIWFKIETIENNNGKEKKKRKDGIIGRLGKIRRQAYSRKILPTEYLVFLQYTYMLNTIIIF